MARIGYVVGYFDKYEPKKMAVCWRVHRNQADAQKDADERISGLDYKVYELHEMETA